MKETQDLKQKCLDQISSGLTKDLEAAYIQAYALLRIADWYVVLVERQEEAAKHSVEVNVKKGKA